jgi:hypothetical protein
MSEHTNPLQGRKRISKRGERTEILITLTGKEEEEMLQDK